jgi:hypothetical protein
LTKASGILDPGMIVWRVRNSPGCHIFLFTQHGFPAGLARRHTRICRDFMNFITTGAPFDRAKAIRASMPQHRRHASPQDPYASLSAHELRGIVAAMVD